MDVLLVKTPQGHLVPYDGMEESKVDRIKVGKVVRATFTKTRNYLFHKKFFALLELGFEAYEMPPQEYCGLPMQKDEEKFRERCIIAAGFYNEVFHPDGSMELRAMSINFDNMTQETFERLYSQVADVLLQRVFTRYTRADLCEVVDKIMGFV